MWCNRKKGQIDVSTVEWREDGEGYVHTIYPHPPWLMQYGSPVDVDLAFHSAYRASKISRPANLPHHQRVMYSTYSLYTYKKKLYTPITIMADAANPAPWAPRERRLCHCGMYRGVPHLVTKTIWYRHRQRQAWLERQATQEDIPPVDLDWEVVSTCGQGAFSTYIILTLYRLMPPIPRVSPCHQEPPSLMIRYMRYNTCIVW